jgi:hypothetical protein
MLRANEDIRLRPDNRESQPLAPPTAEWVIETVCEIRSAIALRNLRSRLDVADPLEALHRASSAFEIIGAMHFARALRAAADGVGSASTPTKRRHCLGALEDQLLCSDDPIDSLIARYRWNCIDAPNSVRDCADFTACLSGSTP